MAKRECGCEIYYEETNGKGRLVRNCCQRHKPRLAFSFDGGRGQILKIGEDQILKY